MRHLPRLVASLAILLLLAGCASAPPPRAPSASGPAALDEDPSPPTEPGPLDFLARPREVNRVSSGGEPSILADRNGKFLWIADTSGVYYSTDNGTRWQQTNGYTGDFGGALGDGPGLAQDDQGRLYKASLHDNRGDVARSDDGKAFNQASYFAGYPIDRPWIAAVGTSVVVVYLNNLGAVGYQEACTRSTDSGATFTDRNPVSGNHGTGGIYMAPDKSFYFTGDNGVITRHAQTCSDTISFGASTMQMFPSVGVNNLYAMTGWQEKLFAAAAGSGNKMLVSGAAKWAARPKVYTVSPDELKTNTFGAVAARGEDVAVAWYGSTTAGDPSAAGFSGTFDVYVALIRDYFGDSGTPTIQVWKVSERPNHKGQICMGGVTCTGNRGLLDYFGVAFDIWGGIHVAYVEDTSATTTYHALIVPEGEGTPIEDPIVLPTGTQKPGGTANPNPPLTASGAKPVARIRGESLGLTVSLNGEASTGSAPLAYTWDLGDGSEAAGVAINHTYSEPGEYTVRLTVTDPQGREGTASAKINAVAGGGGPVSGEGSRGSPGAGLFLVVAAASAALVLRRLRT
jgi:hypothetical protein